MYISVAIHAIRSAKSLFVAKIEWSARIHFDGNAINRVEVLESIHNGELSPTNELMVRVRQFFVAWHVTKKSALCPPIAISVLSQPNIHRFIIGGRGMNFLALSAFLAIASPLLKRGQVHGQRTSPSMRPLKTLCWQTRDGSNHILVSTICETQIISISSQWYRIRLR